MDPRYDTNAASEDIQASERYGFDLRSSNQGYNVADDGFSREARAAWNKIQQRYKTAHRKPNNRRWTATGIVKENVTDIHLKDNAVYGYAVPTAPPLDDLDLLMDECITLKNNLTEQLVLIQSRMEFTEQTKERGQTKVTEFFTVILDIITDKKKQILKQLEEKYTKQKCMLATLLKAVENGLDAVNAELIIVGDRKTKHGYSQNVLIKETKMLLSDIKVGNEKRKEQLGKQFDQTVKVNQSAIETVSDMTYAIITEETQTDSNVDLGCARQGSEVATSYISQRLSSGLNNPNARSQTVMNNNSDNTRVNPVDTLVGNDSATPFIGRSPTGISVSTPEVHPCPSAPTEEAEPPPPSYLEAVTYRIPYTRSASPILVSSYSRNSSVIPSDITVDVRRPKQLFCLQNISIVERKDTKPPIPVALVWKFGKIYIADKANGIVKFCTPPASWVLSERYFNNFEMNDLIVLEMGINGICFVVSSPRSLQFINVTGPSSRDVKVRRVKLNEGYNSIAAGPNNDSIVGANALPNVGNPRIDIIDLNGQVMKSFTKTPWHKNFIYPRCVEVFNDKIIVADLKLNLVVMFNTDGRGIGQYTGTPVHPLLEPISMTLDHVGNPMVLSGGTANIHVLDAQCRPLEIIEFPGGDSIPIMIAFDIKTHRIAGVRPSGVVAIYDFKDA